MYIQHLSPKIDVVKLDRIIRSDGQIDNNITVPTIPFIYPGSWWMAAHVTHCWAMVCKEQSPAGILGKDFFFPDQSKMSFMPTLLFLSLKRFSLGSDGWKSIAIFLHYSCYMAFYKSPFLRQCELQTKDS